MQHDRRVRRSQDPLVALHYQLAEARKETEVDILVVADACGTVLAGAGAWPLCEELAAYAPLLEVPPADGSATMGRVAMLRDEVSVQRVSVDESPVLLCARGGAARAASMGKTAEAVRRILSRAA